MLLTTQYLDEADQLAGRISVVDHGRVIAEGTPDELKSQVGGDRLECVVRDPTALPEAARILARVTGAEPDLDAEGRRASAPVGERLVALAALLHGLDAAGVEAEDVGVRRPTLDEAFLHLTGHAASPDPATTTEEETAA